MTIGQIVAKRFKRQYFSKRQGGWSEMDWEIEPEQVHLILLELKSRAACEALLGSGSWTRRIPKKLPPRRDSASEK